MIIPSSTARKSGPSGKGLQSTEYSCLAGSPSQVGNPWNPSPPPPQKVENNPTSDWVVNNPTSPSARQAAHHPHPTHSSTLADPSAPPRPRLWPPSLGPLAKCPASRHSPPTPSRAPGEAKERQAGEAGQLAFRVWLAGLARRRMAVSYPLLSVKESSVKHFGEHVSRLLRLFGSRQHGPCSEKLILP